MVKVKSPEFPPRRRYLREGVLTTGSRGSLVGSENENERLWQFLGFNHLVSQFSMIRYLFLLEK